MVPQGICHPQNLTIFGEPPKKYPYRREDSIHLGFWGNCHNPDIFLGASVDRRHLLLQYDSTGFLEKITPLTDIYHTQIKLFKSWPNLLTSAGSLAALLQKGTAEVKINSRYSYLLSSDSRSVSAVKFVRQKPSDKLTMPLQINPEYIISRTLADPINAPLELDRSWHSANVFHILGVDWLRQ